MIEQIHTSCRDCIFSVKDKQTQTSCEFGRIDLYKESGAEVIEAYDEFNNEFYVINNKYCLYKRTKDWADHYTTSEIKSIVESQVKPRYHAVVFHDKEGTLEGLKTTLDSLKSQYNSPSIVTVAKTNDIDTLDMMSFMTAYDGVFDWSVQQFLDDEQTIRERIDFVMDRTKKKKFTFYAVFDAPYAVPEGFSEELQDTLLNKMKPFAVAKQDDSFNGMIVSHVLHIKHAGNCFGIHLEDKIKEFEENGEKYICDIEEICPCLKPSS